MRKATEALKEELKAEKIKQQERNRSAAARKRQEENEAMIQKLKDQLQEAKEAPSDADAALSPTARLRKAEEMAERLRLENEKLQTAASPKGARKPRKSGFGSPMDELSPADHAAMMKFQGELKQLGLGDYADNLATQGIFSLEDLTEKGIPGLEGLGFATSQAKRIMEQLKIMMKPQNEDIVVDLAKRRGEEGKAWGFTVHKTTMQLTKCPLGSIAARNKKMRTCMNKALYKVNDTIVKTPQELAAASQAAAAACSKKKELSTITLIFKGEGGKAPSLAPLVFGKAPKGDMDDIPVVAEPMMTDEEIEKQEKEEKAKEKKKLTNERTDGEGELRIDPNDGMPYPQWSFLEVYGGLAEWNK
eukprot:gene23722-979_t